MRQIQHTVRLKFEAGTNTLTEVFKLPAGFVKSMVANPNGNEKSKGQIVKLGLKDDDSIDIIPLIHIDHFRQTGGEYEKSFKPLNFDSENKKFALTMTSNIPATGNDAEDVVVDVTFLFDTNVK